MSFLVRFKAKPQPDIEWGEVYFIMRKKIFLMSLFLFLSIGYTLNGQADDVEDSGEGEGGVVEIVCTAWPATEGRCFICKLVFMNGTRWVCTYTGNTLNYCMENYCPGA